VQTIFTALFALLTPDRVGMALAFQLLANFPFAWITLCCYVSAGLNVPQRDLGLALGLVGTFRFLGGAVGTTVFSTILSNKASSSIPARVLNAVAPLGFPASKVPALITSLSATNATALTAYSPTIIQAATKGMQWGYSDAFRVTWLATIPFGIIACVIALFVRDVSPYFTAHTAVSMEKERLGGNVAQPVLSSEEKDGSV